MNITCISDTHSQHNSIPSSNLPGGDIIIHAGDVSRIGKKDEIISFLEWFSNLPYTHKIFCAGNHDFFFDHSWKPITLKGEGRFKHHALQHTELEITELLSLYPQVTYLNDSEVVIDGIKFWGSPITPWFHDWAFNKDKNVIFDSWKLIPDDTDVLITHGPLYGFLDKTIGGDVVGCGHLLSKVINSNIKLHICGHIHESYGHQYLQDKLLVNASVLDENYVMKNKPHIIDSSNYSII